MLSRCEKTQICFLLNLLCSHPVWVFSVFLICPSDIGNHRVMIDLAPRRLLQLQVKHKGEYRKNSELGKKKGKFGSRLYVQQNLQGVPKVRSSNFMRYNFWSKLHFYMKFLKYVSYSIEYLCSEVQLPASPLCFFITLCSRCGIKWDKRFILSFFIT